MIQRLDSRTTSPGDFQTQYVARGLPVVLTHALDSWDASTKWTLDFFRTVHGEQQVAVDHGAVSGNRWQRTTLAQYIDSFQEHAEQAETGSAAHNPYLRTWHFADDLPELLDDFEALPHFPDMFQQLSPSLRPPFLWLFLCPAGAQTRLHVDIWHTDAWLAQIQGSKHFTLYHPSHRQYLEHGDQMADIHAPDPELFPDFGRAQPVEVILGPSEVLYIPRKWPHHAVSLQPSISLTGNFLSRSNRSAVLPLLAKYMQRRSMCERILGRPLRAGDSGRPTNLMAFCCHGGRIPADVALRLLKLGGTSADAPDASESECSDDGDGDDQATHTEPAKSWRH
ncbi:hypothetical protein WJX72_000966 [[Myrmecia] bisecta]|uniref:JmjC domain-containing protein n=1 Tax=[Myrmecia] bisecta TaxID=41462 RepID=A0AAW1Q6G6_9CHLO